MGMFRFLFMFGDIFRIVEIFKVFFFGIFLWFCMFQFVVIRGCCGQGVELRMRELFIEREKERKDKVMIILVYEYFCDFRGFEQCVWFFVFIL